METLQKLSIPLSIIIAGGIIAGAVVFALKPSAGTTDGTTPPPQANVDVKDVKISASDPIIGNPNAPVTLVYWFDYQCPFCKQFEEVTLPTLVEKYVAPGKLRIVMKDFPFLGNDSTTAAEYAHAVWETYPDKYKAWHDAMFAAQDAEGDQGFGDEASILKLTAKISGMDGNKLKALVASKKKEYDALLTEGQQEGVKFGIEGTPGFVTGKKMIGGAQPTNIFTAAIDEQLK